MGQEITQEQIAKENEEAKGRTRYLRLVEGEELVITVDRIEKNTEARYKLLNEDYAIELITSENKILTVNSWALWSKLRQLFTEENKHKGLKIGITRVAKGKYSVIKKK